jgi:hypothetical protein
MDHTDSLRLSRGAGNRAFIVPKSGKKPVRVSAHRLRSNLLRKLGHIPPPTVTPCNYNKLAVSLLGHAPEERLPLKGYDQEVDINDKVFEALGTFLWNQHPPRDHHNSNRSCQHNRPRSVRFHPQVSVVCIPSRHEYSARIGRFLWDSPEQMYRAIARNTLEFRADGWDWKTVLEEEEHIWSPATKEYIHPIHLEIAEMPPEEQELLVPSTYINPVLLQGPTQPY